MNPTLSTEAVEFGAAAERAFAGIGGVDAARRAETDPAVRRHDVPAALTSLGVEAVDPRRDLDTASAAATLCRMAGRVALPYPLVGVLLRHGSDGLPFALVPDDAYPVDHGDLFTAWRVGTVDGRVSVAEPASRRLGSRLGPFVAYLTPVGPATGEAGVDVGLHLTLTAWQILGTVERAIELAVAHVNDRVQFGRPLASFQAVQFQLADAAVAASGLAELCQFALWRIFTDPDAALPDALATRLNAIDTARTVLRTTQQLHGASGLCDEYDISVLGRHAQPALRLPIGAERTATKLADAIGRFGFESLFTHGRAGGP